MAEREPIEKETLIFDRPEKAQEFSERAIERVAASRRGEVTRDREVLAQEVAREFEKEGEAVDVLSQPWEHTQEEHSEVQDLVNISFSKNLHEALKKARESKAYPRNLDLFHDVLTDQLYDMLVKEKLNKQQLSELPVVIGAVVVAGIFLLILIVVILMVA